MVREGHAAAAAPLPRRRDALLSILVDVKGHNRAPQNRAPAHTSAPRGEATARRANDAWAVQGGGTGAWGGRGVAEGLAGGGRALEQRTWRRSRPPCLASKNERKKVTSALQVPGPSKSWDPAPAALSLRCSQCPCTGCSCYSRSSGSNCSRESASMNRIADLAVYLSLVEGGWLRQVPELIEDVLRVEYAIRHTATRTRSATNPPRGRSMPRSMTSGSRFQMRNRTSARSARRRLSAGGRRRVTALCVCPPLRLHGRRGGGRRAGGGQRTCVCVPVPKGAG